MDYLHAFSALVQNTPLLLLFALPILALTVLGSLSPALTGWLQPRLARILLVSCAALAFVYVATALHHVFTTDFRDHVEVSVIDTARLLGTGAPLYHELDTASRYALLYGPNCFLALWAAMRLLPDPVLAPKLCAALFALAALALVFATMRRSIVCRQARWLGLAYFCAMCLLVGYRLVWVRSDSQLLFWVALGLWASLHRSTWLAFLLVGACAGAAFDAKLHGILYFLPIVAVLLPRGRVRHWAALAGLGVLVAAAPFLLIPSVSASNYLLWLKMASRHGFGLLLPLSVAMTLGFMLMPLALAAVGHVADMAPERRRELFRATRVQLILAVLAVAAIFVVSSKNGAGEWHLIPLLPTGAWLLAALLDRDSLWESRLPFRGLAGSAWAAVLILALANAGFVLCDVGAVYLRTEPAALDLSMADARALAAKFPGQNVAVGYGENKDFPASFARLALPVQEKLMLDAAALMDMRLSRVGLPPSTVTALSDGAVQVWLIPKNSVPFAMVDLFRHESLFSPAFQHVFHQHYRKVAEGQVFAAWHYYPRFGLDTDQRPFGIAEAPPTLASLPRTPY
jgi:hypothetical protein